MIHVDISGDGTIILGDSVTCDGFRYKYPIRIQSHCHKDHMEEFERSKGQQQILMTNATRDLLIAGLNADIPYRDNLEAVPLNQPIMKEGVEIILIDNDHMLGSVQIAVSLSNGIKCGYSGDFNWPLDNVIQVDELVVDSTYGSPDSIRRYSNEEANCCLEELVIKTIKKEPIYIKAHRGTLHRAITILNGLVNRPIIANPTLYKEILVHLKYGYNCTEVIPSDSEEAVLARKNGNYIQMANFHETNPEGTTSIILSAHMSRDNAVTQYSEHAYLVGLSNHADYLGTIEYVKATKAKKVITDNTRGGNAVQLALSLQQVLGLEAKPSLVRISNEWGE